jgi:hypothetical protein
MAADKKLMSAIIGFKMNVLAVNKYIKVFIMR